VDLQNAIGHLSHAFFVIPTRHVLANRPTSRILHRNALTVGLRSQRSHFIVGQPKRHSHGAMVSERHHFDWVIPDSSAPHPRSRNRAFMRPPFGDVGWRN
jgi:hypothetical protein